MLYRIYTEDVNRSKIESIVAKHFEGFTIVSGTGFWELQREQTIIIDIVGESVKCYDKIKCICKEIKEMNDQESVLVFTVEGHGFFI